MWQSLKSSKGQNTFARHCNLKFAWKHVVGIWIRDFSKFGFSLLENHFKCTSNHWNTSLVVYEKNKINPV